MDDWNQEQHWQKLPRKDQQYLQEGRVRPFTTWSYELSRADDATEAFHAGGNRKWVRWTVGEIERTNPANKTPRHQQKDLNDALIITFPGTDAENIKDIMTDLKARKEQLDGYESKGKIEVHKGFQQRYRDARATIHQILEQVAAEDGRDGKLPRNIQVMGHSLGGALAQLCVLDLQQHPLARHSKIQSLVFDAPPIGDKNAAKLFKNKEQYNFHRRDSPVAFAKDGGLTPTYKRLGLYSPVKDIEIDYSPESRALRQQMDADEKKLTWKTGAAMGSRAALKLGSDVLPAVGGWRGMAAKFALDALDSCTGMSKQNTADIAATWAKLKGKNKLARFATPHAMLAFAFGTDWQHTADRAYRPYNFQQDRRSQMPEFKGKGKYSFGLNSYERGSMSEATRGKTVRSSQGTVGSILLSEEPEAADGYENRVFAFGDLVGTAVKRAKTHAGDVAQHAKGYAKALQDIALEHPPAGVRYPRTWPDRDPAYDYTLQDAGADVRFLGEASKRGARIAHAHAKTAGKAIRKGVSKAASAVPAVLHAAHIAPFQEAKQAERERQMTNAALFAQSQLPAARELVVIPNINIAGKRQRGEQKRFVR